MAMKFNVYGDPGHSWLQVPYRYIKRAGVEKDITSFSYVRRNKQGDIQHVYLEEDVDWYTFEHNFDKPIEVKERYSDRQSRIRSYEHYPHPLKETNQ